MIELKGSITLIKNCWTFNILTLILLITTNSCSIYIKLIEPKPKVKILKDPKTPQYCKQKQKIQIAHQSPSATKKIFKYIKAIEKKHKLSFYDKAILLTFYQILLRPDATNNYSRLQIIYGRGKNIFYKDYNPLKSKNTNLIINLENFLKENKNRKNITQLAKLADKYFPKNIPITRELSQFIQQNRTNLKQDTNLLKNFFKIGQPLQQGETLKAFSLKKFIYQSLKRKSQRYNQTNTPLFSYQPKELIENTLTNNTLPKSISIQCNTDYSLYDKSTFLISPENSTQSNTFALYEKKKHFFLAITSNQVKRNRKILSYKKTYSLKSSPPKWPAPFCLIQNKEWKMALLGMKDRDPRQHLFHLIQYGIKDVKHLESFAEYIRFPRYQTLKNPNRILFEKERGTESQLEEFLKHNIPIYYAPKLGEVWGLFRTSSKQLTLVTDNRYPVYQTCQ